MKTASFIFSFLIIFCFSCKHTLQEELEEKLEKNNEEIREAEKRINENIEKAGSNPFTFKKINPLSITDDTILVSVYDYDSIGKPHTYKMVKGVKIEE